MPTKYGIGKKIYGENDKYGHKKIIIQSCLDNLGKWYGEKRQNNEFWETSAGIISCVATEQ